MVTDRHSCNTRLKSIPITKWWTINGCYSHRPDSRISFKRSRLLIVYPNVTKNRAMTQASPEDLKWIGDIDKIALEIRKHIPIREVSLIIEDYIVTPQPSMLTDPYCLHCNGRHKRRVSSLCSNCADVCVICTKRACKNEKTLVCTNCINIDYKNFTLAASQNMEKSQLYAAWHKVRFPSDIERNYLARLKREAEDPVRQAALAEKKRKEDEFYAIENAKHPWVQVTELRAKLWEVYREVAEYKANNRGAPGLKVYPAFPFY